MADEPVVTAAFENQIRLAYRPTAALLNNPPPA
jgi:hypothetical protein